MRRWLLRIVLAAVVVLLVIQVLPIGKVHDSPATKEAPWPDAASKQIAVAACYDCHSNHTHLLWYDKVAPVSWYVANHIEEGRSKVNFEEWDKPQNAHELAESVQEGGMPLTSYTLLHPSGKLSAAEKAKLVAALRQLEGTAVDRRGGREGDDG
jgi:hypothetical protein